MQLHASQRVGGHSALSSAAFQPGGDAGSLVGLARGRQDDGVLHDIIGNGVEVLVRRLQARRGGWSIPHWMQGACTTRACSGNRRVKPSASQAGLPNAVLGLNFQITSEECREPARSWGVPGMEHLPLVRCVPPSRSWCFGVQWVPLWAGCAGSKRLGTRSPPPCSAQARAGAPDSLPSPPHQSFKRRVDEGWSRILARFKWVTKHGSCWRGVPAALPCCCPWPCGPPSVGPGPLSSSWTSQCMVCTVEQHVKFRWIFGGGKTPGPWCWSGGWGFSVGPGFENSPKGQVTPRLMFGRKERQASMSLAPTSPRGLLMVSTRALLIPQQDMSVCCV